MLSSSDGTSLGVAKQAHFLAPNAAAMSSFEAFVPCDPVRSSPSCHEANLLS